MKIWPYVNEVLNLFQFLSRLLSYNNLKLFSTYPVGRNCAMWKTCFSAPQNAKKENQLKHKNQVRDRLYIDSQVLEYEGLTSHFGVNTKKQTSTLNSIKIMRIWKFLFTRSRVLKHKVVVSNLHVCSNGLGKMRASNIFHFSTRNLTSIHMKLFNIFLA